MFRVFFSSRQTERQRHARNRRYKEKKEEEKKGVGETGKRKNDKIFKN